ncbi:MAG: hypothetical protein SH868_02685 [Bythopirellula sp.]|nr:hypothetical protein [Bythopirellula sp.]
MNERPPEPENTETFRNELTPEEFLARYQEQQQRLTCSGCGEEPFIG